MHKNTGTYNTNKLCKFNKLFVRSESHNKKSDCFNMSHKGSQVTVPVKCSVM